MKRMVQPRLGWVRVTHQRRALWSAAASLQTSANAASFVESVRRDCLVDVAWALDFPRLEKLAAGKGQGAGADVLVEMERALIAGAAAHPVETLELSLSSPESFAAAAVMVKCVGRSLRALRLHADSAAAFAQPAHGGPLGVASVRRRGGPFDTADLTASVLAAFIEVRRGGEDTAVTPLESLEVVSLDGNLESPHYASDALVTQLIRLLSQPSSAVALRSLVLRQLDCQQCDEAAVEELARVVGCSTWAASLTAMDLSGSALLLLHLLRGQGLRACTSLAALDVSNCVLGDVWTKQLFDELAAGIGGWHALSSFKASQSGLTGYALDCMLTQLRAMTDSAGTAATTCLALSANRLGDDAAHTLAMCLVRCHALEELDLRHSEFTERSSEVLVASLAHATGLRVLCLRSNRLGVQGAVHLAAYAKCWPSLQVLDLTRCRITGAAGVLALATALSHLESLQRLHLSGNDLRVHVPAATVVGLAGDSGDGDPNLKLFAYDSNYMKGDSGGKVPTSFELDRRDRATGRVRYRGPTVEAEAGEKTATPTDPFTLLGEALSSCSALRVLDLTDCCLSDAHFVSLAACVAPAQLQELRLSANPLFVDDGAAVAALVQLLWCVTETLQVLDLGFTGLGDWGLATLCDGPIDDDNGGERQRGVLSQLTALRTLQMPHARVGALGLEALADAVAGLSRLQVLLLEGNTDIGVDGEVEAGGALRCVMTLLQHLTTPDGADEGRSGTSARTSGTTSLRVVSLSGCLNSSSAARRQVLASPVAHQLTRLGVDLLL